ncbi:MAG: PilZ domain-containing protein [Candidatus Omnitrophota bacterium]
MSPWEGLNRRKFPRINYPCLVTVWLEGEGGENDAQTFLTHTENIGIGGVCLFCHNRLKLFDKVEMELDLLDMEDHLRCKGRVVWAVQRKEPESRKPVIFDIGIEFDGLKEEETARILKIVRQMEKKQEASPW